MKRLLPWLTLLSLPLLAWGLMALTGARQDRLPDRVSFNFHIRPLLAQNCYSCHGPDPSGRKADLRLDTEEGATALLEKGRRAIVPGDASASELIRRIHSQDPEQQMPPPDSKKSLSDYEIALLEKWIDQGAQWETFWAFVPARPTPGLPQNTSAAIDQLLLQGLEDHDLSPSPIASPESRMRRLSYVLTGLPPSPEEVQAFAANPGHEQYALWVDYYLQSPRFGERWARHWMDLMRYAETQGHEFDYVIDGAWRYRDYLIRAFNADVPYEQLIREHLAGDMLTKPRTDPSSCLNESPIGTMYMALGEGKHSPVNIRQEEADRIDNTIDVTTKAFLGLTVGCARCHDHKFDPIPTTDYYRLYGLFESARFARVPANLGDWQSLVALEHAQTERLYDYVVTTVDTSLYKTLLTTPGPSLYKPLLTTPGPSLKRRGDSLASTPPFQGGDRGGLRSPNQGGDRGGLSSATKGRARGGLRSPTWPDTVHVWADFRDGNDWGWQTDGPAFAAGNTLRRPIVDSLRRQMRLPAQGSMRSDLYGRGVPGALRSPNFTLKKSNVSFRARGELSRVRLIIDNFQLIQYPIYGMMEQSLNDGQWHTYTIDDQGDYLGHKAYLEVLPGTYSQHHYQYQADAWVEIEWVVNHDGKLVEPAFKASTNTAKVAIPDSLVPQRLPLAQLRDDQFYMGVVEGDPVYSPVFVRGQITQPGDEKLRHGMLEVLSGGETFEGERDHRLDFAEALTEADNPLTARVMVNRLWHHVFGRGIVATPDNFGLQGSLPTHPALLDELALRFVQEGWSIKQMIRAMVLTDAFQRSSVPRAAVKQKDPQNLYLSHYPVRRLEAEAIRDAMLAVAGCLDTTMYGPSVPLYLTEFMQGRGRPGRSGPLDGQGRRSVYQSIRRNFLPPFLQAFDLPVPFTAFGKRNVSNVPAQSLSLMNDPFVIEQANYWAHNLLTQPLDPQERITQLYWRAFSRSPEATEVAAGRAFLQQQQTLYCEDEDAESRSWADYTHMLFNLKEFIYLP